jgi:RNA polymerase sigma-70 factor, ECF subfamily
MEHDLTGVDDAQLVVAVAGGQESALAELYRRHGAAVTGLARRILGDESLADDITQEIFVWLWRNADRFDPKRGRLRTMLLTQAHGKSIDLIRSRNARSERENKLHDRSPADNKAIDTELMEVIEMQQVRNAVNKLPNDERIPLELAYFGGNTYRVVATILDLPEGTVKTRIRSALRRLHGFLNEPSGPLGPMGPSGPNDDATPRTISPRKEDPWTAS